MNHVRVVGWEEFQHYKDRSPAWIKLHLKLAENVVFSGLKDTEKVHLLGLWILAARTNNCIPVAWVERTNMSSKRVNLKPLLVAGFLEKCPDSASTAASNGASTDASEPAIPAMLALEEKRRDVEAKASTRKPRKPDPLWDALAENIGPVSNGMERGRRNKALKALRESGATPELIAERVRAYVKLWPGVSLTDTALAANWTQLGEVGPRLSPKRPVAEAAEDWVRNVGWQYPNVTIVDELNKRGVLADDLQRLLEYAAKRREAA